VSEDERQKLKDDFNQIWNRGNEIGRTLDWDFRRILQVEDEIKAYFRRDLRDDYGDSIFECQDWEHALGVREPIF